MRRLRWQDCDIVLVVLHIQEKLGEYHSEISNDSINIDHLDSYTVHNVFKFIKPFFKKD
jgi:hypothetical protein